MMENVPSIYYMGGSDDAFFSDIKNTFENAKPMKVSMYFL
jgi:hypothetical protein